MICLISKRAHHSNCPHIARVRNNSKHSGAPSAHSLRARVLNFVLIRFCRSMMEVPSHMASALFRSKDSRRRRTTYRRQQFCRSRCARKEEEEEEGEICAGTGMSAISGDGRGREGGREADRQGGAFSIRSWRGGEGRRRRSVGE